MGSLILQAMVISGWKIINIYVEYMVIKFNTMENQMCIPTPNERFHNDPRADATHKNDWNLNSIPNQLCIFLKVSLLIHTINSGAGHHRPCFHNPATDLDCTHTIIR